jgi:hypothetical protein
MKRRLLVLTLAISVLPQGVSARRAGAFDVPTEFSARSPLHPMLDEADPTNLQSCESMGKISVIYETGNSGPPSVGLRITDPRGRKIGYDPRVPKVWQELSLTEGFVDCEQDDDTTLRNHCAAHIQICGPVSGTYKLEVLPTQNAKYFIGVVGLSQQTPDQIGFHSTDSRAEYKSEIQRQEPEILMLTYSRQLGTRIKLGTDDSRVTASDKSQAQKPLH